MFNRCCIIKKAKYVAFVVAIALLLVGYGQSADHSEHGEISSQREQGESSGQREYGESSGQRSAEIKKLQKKIELLKFNFAVQSQILIVFDDCASRLVEIVGTIKKVEIEKPNCYIARAMEFGRTASKIKQEEKKQYRENRDKLLATALNNFRSDIPIVSEMIEKLSSDEPFFVIPDLSALSNWLNLAQKQEDVTSGLSLSKLVRLLDELVPILKQMANSANSRQLWRKKAKELFYSKDNPAAQDEFKKLNDQRVVYDSLYIRLSVVKAMLAIGMIATENKKNAATVVTNQQEMARELKEAANHMRLFLQREEQLLARMEDNEEDQKLTSDKLADLYIGHNLVSIGLPGKVFFKHRMAEGDEKAFAILLMGKEPEEDYLPDGLVAVMKYQLMQDIATRRLLEDAVIVNTKEELKKKSELIMENFDVQIRIFSLLETLNDRFNDIFRVENSRTIKAADEGKLDEIYRDKLLDNVISKCRKINLLSELKTIRQLINNTSPELFEQQGFTVLKKWLKTKKWSFLSQKPLKTNASQRITSILKEFDLILGQMTRSTNNRQQWRQEIKELIIDRGDSFALEKVKKLNDHRILYDSVYIRLSMVKIMLEIIMTAHKNEPGTADFMTNQQNMSHEREDTAQKMNWLIEGDEKRVCNSVKRALDGGELFKRDQLGDWYRRDEYREMGFTGKVLTARLAEGDEPAFAKLMRNVPEYVPDEFMAVLKYQAVQDLAALWQLENAAADMEIAQNK